MAATAKLDFFITHTPWSLFRGGRTGTVAIEAGSLMGWYGVDQGVFMAISRHMWQFAHNRETPCYAYDFAIWRMREI
ncbi:MAG TPA: hypothetical protein VGG27_16470 [Magnetospirillaceae bacterium]|jgi:hypothetical protein